MKYNFVLISLTTLIYPCFLNGSGFGYNNGLNLEKKACFSNTRPEISNLRKKMNIDFPHKDKFSNFKIGRYSYHYNIKSDKPTTRYYNVAKKPIQSDPAILSKTYSFLKDKNLPVEKKNKGREFFEESRTRSLTPEFASPSELAEDELKQDMDESILMDITEPNAEVIKKKTEEEKSETYVSKLVRLQNNKIFNEETEERNVSQYTSKQIDSIVQDMIYFSKPTTHNYGIMFQNSIFYTDKTRYNTFQPILKSNSGYQDCCSFPDDFLRTEKIPNVPKNLEMIRDDLINKIKGCKEIREFECLFNTEPILLEKTHEWSIFSFEHSGVKVMVKLVSLDIDSNVEYFEKRVKISKILSEKKHMNVVEIYNAFYENDVFYEVYEYLDGISFHDFLTRIKNKQDFDTTQTMAGILEQCINGLLYLQANDIYHLDMNPRSIFIQKDGTVKIINYEYSQLGKDLEILSCNLSSFEDYFYFSPERNYLGTITKTEDFYELASYFFVFYEERKNIHEQVTNNSLLWRLKNKIVNGKRHFINPKFYSTPEPIRKIIEPLLIFDYKERVKKFEKIYSPAA